MKSGLSFNLSLILSIGMLAFMVNAQQRPASPVNVVSAEIRSLSPIAWVSGTIVSRNNSQIAADVSGRLVSLADVGDRVFKNDVLAITDSRSFELKKLEEVANVKNAKSRLKFLESEVIRKSSLAKRNLSAKTDLDQTISDRNVAKGDVDAANARLSQTEQNISYAQLRAPFEGLVVERLSNQGEYINSGTAIIRLVETKNAVASVFAPLTAYQFLKHSESLAIESPLGKGLAPIKALVPVADTRSHLMEVRLDVSKLDWPIGLNIKVAIANGLQEEVVAVPRDALVLRREGASVFKIDSDNKAQQIQVSVGIGAGELVQVIGEVAPGDLIVIRGAERLQSGQSVQIKENNQSLISGKQPTDETPSESK